MKPNPERRRHPEIPSTLASSRRIRMGGSVWERKQRSSNDRDSAAASTDFSWKPELGKKQSYISLFLFYFLFLKKFQREDR